uniref:Uncharacterized protein n=1 Tax=Rhipicephalus pulchellus TaxID=72859 RepID=L7LUC8_RHIPC
MPLSLLMYLCSWVLFSSFGKVAQKYHVASRLMYLSIRIFLVFQPIFFGICVQVPFSISLPLPDELKYVSLGMNVFVVGAKQHFGDW